MLEIDVKSYYKHVVRHNSGQAVYTMHRTRHYSDSIFSLLNLRFVRPRQGRKQMVYLKIDTFVFYQ